MNKPHNAPADVDNPDTDLPLLLEDVLLHIDELQQSGVDTTEIEDLRAYAASLRARLR